MFEDVEIIENMTNEEYRQVLYYLKHHDEYPGDYDEFLAKIIDYGSQINERGVSDRYLSDCLGKKKDENMIKHMTKSEEQVMALLWKSDRPLSCTEIVEQSEDKTWKDSYVHLMIKSLIRKELVQIASFELVSRSYARKFAPKLSYSEYVLLSAFSKEDLKDTNKMADLIQTIFRFSETDELKKCIQDMV